MIKHKPDPAAVIRALRSAAPYIRLFKGKTFVVKAGGGVFGDVILDTARRQRSRALPLRPKGHHRAKVAIGCAHDLRDHSQNAAGFAQAS